MSYQICLKNAAKEGGNTIDNKEYSVDFDNILILLTWTISFLCLIKDIDTLEHHCQIYWVRFCEDFAWYICLFLMATTFIVWLTNQNDGCSPFPKDKLSCSVRFFFFFPETYLPTRLVEQTAFFICEHMLRRSLRWGSNYIYSLNQLSG